MPASLPFLRDWCLTGLIFLCLSCPAFAEEAPQDKGVFLVATEQLDGTSFQRTVILITHTGAQGTLGLAINRPTGASLHEVFPEVGPLPPNVDMLFLGGPIGSNVVSTLVRTSQPSEGMKHIAADLYLAAGETTLEQPIGDSIRFYAGYVGWAPGQLQAEIKHGDWHVIKKEPGIIFEGSPSGLWQRLNLTWSGKWI